MEGHTRKRGDKWYYSFEASNVDGKRKRIERVGGRTKKDAEAALRIALQEYNNAGLHFEPSEMSVSDYMDYWFKNYVLINCKYNTQTCYELIIKNHIKPALGIYKLKSLTPAILQEFINGKYLSGYSKNHLMNITTVLNGSLKYAVHPCKFIKDTPMQYVKYPKYDHSKREIDHKVISNDDFSQIIERFPLGSTFHIPLMIGYYTGCRIGEVMGLTWDDIDLENATIDINKLIYKREKDWYFGSTKTSSSVRNIKIGKTLLTDLKKHKKWQTENRLKYGQYFIQQYEVEELINDQKLRRIHSLQISINASAMNPINMICTKENGEMITPDSFKYAAKVIHYELGIIFNFHSLRHTHATTLIENGANIKDVQNRLGHANIETTLGTYTHATEKMAEQSVDIFEKAANQSLPTKK
ncbi:integrase [Sporomusaceae bacterium BoRhaA]|uniref:tyrosine-type recombinase/integrase n=1 Tax=Pelorhabdus rhamnosifermentans TaxID=2772457 RepID=UPI001C060C82|nr:tyrosine-type recombinase/integrase [Pelorhabdus rhamnosifermentans]MBU2702691.1 integrase [Pelorhabdus rhamnosifermentans]